MLRSWFREIEGFRVLSLFKSYMSREGNTEVYLVGLDYGVGDCEYIDEEFEKYINGLNNYLKGDVCYDSVNEIRGVVKSWCDDIEKMLYEDEMVVMLKWNC